MKSLRFFLSPISRYATLKAAIGWLFGSFALAMTLAGCLTPSESARPATAAPAVNSSPHPADTSDENTFSSTSGDKTEVLLTTAGYNVSISVGGS